MGPLTTLNSASQQQVSQIIRNEGVRRGLWRGWTPALCMQAVYGQRIGYYQYLRHHTALSGGADGRGGPSFAQKLGLGVGVGAFAALTATPFDFLMVKVQGMQHAAPARASAATAGGASFESVAATGARGKSTMAVSASSGVRPAAVSAAGAPGPLRVAAEVVRAHGLRGMFRGAVPTCARAGVLTAFELGSYDEIKARLGPVLGDTVANHFASAMGAGLACAVASSPFDVVKTTYMCGRHDGVLACVRAVARDGGGPRAFYRGFWPYYARRFVLPNTLRNVVAGTLRVATGWILIPAYCICTSPHDRSRPGRGPCSCSSRTSSTARPRGGGPRRRRHRSRRHHV